MKAYNFDPQTMLFTPQQEKTVKYILFYFCEKKKISNIWFRRYFQELL